MVYLFQNQTKMKFNMGGAPGMTVYFILHQKGNYSLTVKGAKAETCAIPVEIGMLLSMACYGV